MAGDSPTILWDFEGTLAYRPGLWRAALMDVLHHYEPRCQVDAEQIRPYLRDGFFWHNPERSHTHIKTADAWWDELNVVFARAYRSVGFEPVRAGELAGHVREFFINPKNFVVFDDTIPVLERLAQKGWKHLIVSNHVPELPQIVRDLGLSPYFDFCLTSAITGWEKPNPEAFRTALSLLGEPGTVWVIGDNLTADVRGAEALGLPAILVRTATSDWVEHHAEDLLEAASIIESGGQ